MYINTVLIKILFLTTKYEQIMFVLFQYIYKIEDKKYLFFQILTCSLSLASQFIELIMQYYQNKIKSLNLKKIHYNVNQYQIYIYIITSFFFDAINDINNIGFFMYSREIIVKKFYIINI